MALTRKFLSALGIEQDKIDEIITAHTETVDALKEQRDEYKEQAESVPNLTKELEDLKEQAEANKTDEWQEKYDTLKDQAQRIIREQLSGTERSILIWHYLNMKTWKTIMEWCDVSERKIYYDKNSALSKIVLPEDAIWI